jgi:polysaccharide biosynthesis/export protein
MNNTLMAKWMTFFSIVLVLLAISPALIHTAGAQTAQADTPPVTDVGQETLKNLTPAQRDAIIQEVGKTGGQLTPPAIEALKARPEFQGLSPAEVAKGMELLQMQEAAKKAAVKPAGPETTKEPAGKGAEPAKAAPDETKQVIGEIPKGETLFERAQATGKYQDIPLDLKPFGYDFFRDAAVKVITDSRNIPIPLKYVVGPGDEVRIAL